MKIHCIGIGGIGISALARYYKAQGHEVSGSESAPSLITDKLIQEGIQVHAGHDKNNIVDGIDLLVYTIAISESNPELIEAKERGILCKTYPEALGDITKEKITIAICGTHGKTTTTAMMYYAMKACGINPTLIVGSLLADKGTNFIAGDSDYLIVEACEYRRSFLNLHPTHVLITNIDEDHLDYYKDIHDIKHAFQSFAESIPVEGTLTTHSDVEFQVLCRRIEADTEDVVAINLSVLGEHNRKNAQLVLALLKTLHYNEKQIREGLLQFPGTWRRMEYKGKTLHGVPVYDDYGHHPTEIQASIQALREKYPRDTNQLVMFFQPHLYSRTKALFEDFVSVLKDVDEVFVLPIYRARLEDTTIINEDILVEAINKNKGNAKFLSSLSDIPACVESIDSSHKVIINMGAGNAYEELSKVTLV